MGTNSIIERDKRFIIFNHLVDTPRVLSLKLIVKYLHNNAKKCFKLSFCSCRLYDIEKWASLTFEI